jgi:hypothetical protein
MREFCAAVPAGIRRAFFFLSIAVTGAIAGAAPKTPAPPLKPVGKVDPAEVRQALEQLRQQGIAGDCYLEFQLRVMPRRGDERLLNGKLWLSRNASGSLTRVSLQPDRDQPERRLLVQSGAQSAAWRWEAGKSVELVGVASLFEPLVPNTELTAFDLQMPFVWWKDFNYEGLTRFRGRPAHVMLMRPPTEFAAKYPALRGVRVHLDTQYNALVQTELIGADGAVTKTFSLVDLKKIDDQWIPKSFDLRDEQTRNKTRLSVTGAALNLDFSKTLFEPARLSDDVRPPAAGQIVPIEP